MSDETRSLAPPAGAACRTDLPQGLRAPFEILAAADIPCWLEGSSLHEWLCGTAPAHFRAAVCASGGDILRLFPRAVPTGTRRDIITLPTPNGPLDLRSSLKLTDPRAELSQQPFTVLAIGLEPLAMRWIDPVGGLADLEARRLRTSGDASHWNPVFGLVAARLIAEFGYRADPQVERRARGAAAGLLDTPAVKRRSELRRILMARHCEDGLRFLATTGQEAQLLPGARPDAAARVGRLSRRLNLRMAGWLQNADARTFLRDNRFGTEFARGIYRRIEHHPIETCVSPRNEVALRRLARRLSEEELYDLIALRRADAALVPAEEGGRMLRDLEHFEAALERARVRDTGQREGHRLELDGRAIMQILDCRPGPEVGMAIRVLQEFVEEDPRNNDPATLTARLMAWRNDPCRNS